MMARPKHAATVGDSIHFGMGQSRVVQWPDGEANARFHIRNPSLSAG